MASRTNSPRILAVGTVVLLLLVTATLGRSQSIPVGVQVEAKPEKPVLLHVTLRSSAEVPVTLLESKLPWGSRYSMVLIAVTTEGKCLEKELYIDDPSPERISLKPNEALSGDIDLEKIFRGLDDALKKSDVNLFWAYEAPKELGIARWSGGWVLIPQQTKVGSPKRTLPE